jgi:hypothetical protein
MLDAGCSMLDDGCLILDAGNQIIRIEYPVSSIRYQERVMHCFKATRELST